MRNWLYQLADQIKNIDSQASQQILVLAGRYDKSLSPIPATLQPAFKYIMYLKFFRGLDESSFHHMKRKYMDTSQDIQEECRAELDKLISEDALKYGVSSAVIRQQLEEKIKSTPSPLIAK